MSSKNVSIIICTRHRAESLAQTIASIARCIVPTDVTAELLVVDNGSTDSTKAVVEKAVLENMLVRYEVEPQKGKGYAYNTGLAGAGGDILLFTDDDVRVPPDWIDGMCRPIISGEADAVAGGVGFSPEYAARLAAEPFHTRRAWFAATDDVDPTAPRLVGANMAFSRSILGPTPRFDVHLGPGALGFFEETLLGWQLQEAGARITSRLNVTVEHHFDLSRLDRSGMLSLAARMGASQAYVDWHWHHVQPLKNRSLYYRTRLRLLAHRLRRPYLPWSNQIHLSEVNYVLAMSYYAQLWREQSVPRRYSR